MIKKRFFYTLIISLVITLLSPYYFSSYFEKKPDTLEQNVNFGGPFPFLNQKVDLPSNEQSYPLEINFSSPIKKDTDVKPFMFLLSLSTFFALFFSFYTIIIRFFTKDDRPK
ncbi:MULTISPECIES: hypothetical protein [unclassified Bacillus (in: firmicutes)]|uniref:hypothetical protein n=1 Tax=unclassified Bacillus (in: firmicutes) TaxID=185979 RepID=UPI0008E5FE2F|nr:MULTISPECIES: hypothetical protein [unclassified Bacillus (in: firmicutes)]SFA76422.1 hypothetical protein SAMN02799634_101591 [Bacillus sp. UNCCL13]SFQ66249.1 hypothetical protein SAMN04488577_0866 [Bacillus sp. cl95]